MAFLFPYQACLIGLATAFVNCFIGCIWDGFKIYILLPYFGNTTNAIVTYKGNATVSEDGATSTAYYLRYKFKYQKNNQIYQVTKIGSLVHQSVYNSATIGSTIPILYIVSPMFMQRPQSKGGSPPILSILGLVCFITAYFFCIFHMFS